jgi:hypothetical protein
MSSTFLLIPTLLEHNMIESFTVPFTMVYNLFLIKYTILFPVQFYITYRKFNANLLFTDFLLKTLRLTPIFN